MPGEIKAKTGTCVLNERTAIILDQSKPLIPLDGPLLLTDAVAQAVCRRPELTRSAKTDENAVFLTVSGTEDGSVKSGMKENEKRN